ncbi:MAG: PKD domain-containing protein [Saprospiraceae bacterium]|nr:PKD domain-containing protein [Saprospiraceae bacterium]
MKKLSLPILFLFQPLFLFSQTAQISGIINRYTAVEAVDTCAGRLSVADTSGFRPGQAALLIQMQGADINTANNAQYGGILSMNDAGRFERITIDSVAAGALFTSHRLLHGYGQPTGLQLVSIPHFQQVQVVDTLRAKPWDGTTGGVLALEVSGTLTLDAPVSVSEAGFRGGADFVATNNGCNWFTQQNQFFYPAGDWRGGYKGEGIARTGTGQETGRGPRANGGGGGNDHNAGGGGGGNTSAGGNGGNNADPNPIGCNGYFPGIGGIAPTNAIDRIFMGGGGGAGHANNLLRSKGGRGGGIALVSAGAINGAKTEIYANGGQGSHSFDDGAGGGGGGGSIWLLLGVANPGVLLQATGGRGGNADNGNVDRCMGPGGGGSGGRILCNNMALNAVFTPGAPGITFNSTVGCNNTNNGAQPGGGGFFEFLPAFPQGPNLAFQPEIQSFLLTDTICAGETSVFSVITNDGAWAYQWQVNSGSGWQDVSGGNFSGEQTSALTIQSAQATQNGWQFRCRVQRPGCYEAVSNAATLHILPAPVAGFSSSLVNATVIFTNLTSHAAGILWDFGDGSVSNSPEPAHTYLQEGNYTVTLTAWNACDTVIFQSMVSIFLPPQADFYAPETIIGCETAQIGFANLSSPNSTAYNWSFSGAQPAVSIEENPVVVYTQSGIYEVQLIATNMVGSDTATQFVLVEIFENPVADFSWTVLPNGSVVFNNLSENSSSWSWDFGDGSPLTDAFNTTHQYTASGVYIVTLSAVSPCGVALLQQEIEVSVPGSGTSDAEAVSLTLYPNPADTRMMIDWLASGQTPVLLKATDLAGRTVWELREPPGMQLSLPVSEWPAGIYTIQATFTQGIVSRLFVRQNK